MAGIHLLRHCQIWLHPNPFGYYHNRGIHSTSAASHRRSVGRTAMCWQTALHRSVSLCSDAAWASNGSMAHFQNSHEVMSIACSDCHLRFYYDALRQCWSPFLQSIRLPADSGNLRHSSPCVNLPVQLDCVDWVIIQVDYLGYDADSSFLRSPPVDSLFRACIFTRNY